MGKDLRREAKGSGVMLWTFQKQRRTIKDIQETRVWSNCLGCHCQVHFVVNSTWLALPPISIPAAVWVLGSLILAPSQLRVQGSWCISSKAFGPFALKIVLCVLLC